LAVFSFAWIFIGEPVNDIVESVEELSASLVFVTHKESGLTVEEARVNVGEGWREVSLLGRGGSSEANIGHECQRSSFEHWF
jgi:hypothetical protein